MVKNCVMCNKEFEAKGNVVTCSVECKKREKEYRKGIMQERSEAPYLKLRNKGKEQLQLKNIAEVNAIARKAGLTYGEYVARCCNG